MNLSEELHSLIKARAAGIVVRTVEEERLQEIIENVCKERNQPFVIWELGSGFLSSSPEHGIVERAKDPEVALNVVESVDTNPIFLFKDFHAHWNAPAVKRRLRTLLQNLKYTSKSIIFSTHELKPPREIENQVVVIELPLPDINELSAILEQLEKAPGVHISIDAEDRNRLLQNASGLTSDQALRIFSRCIVNDGKLNAEDIDILADEKRKVLGQTDLLDYYPSMRTDVEVGGLVSLKNWLLRRKAAFSQEAKEYGLPTPGGIALIGIPGTGKSLMAKYISKFWRQPLFRLDVGSLFNSLVGQSEARTRDALQLAEIVSPCILWIDEIEKALAIGGHDGGTSNRVFSTILTWMQEKQSPCFIVATANNVDSLPPELLRRGRFDEIFFLDLPTEAERKAIITVHLKKRGRNPENFDLSEIASKSQGYVGSEIEQGIIDSMFNAFAEDRQITTEDIVNSLSALIPMSVSQKEIISACQKWLKEGRARSASGEGDSLSETQVF